MAWLKETEVKGMVEDQAARCRWGDLDTALAVVVANIVCGPSSGRSWRARNVACGRGTA